MTKRILGIGLLMTLTVAIPSIARTELLWPEGAPHAVGEEDLDKPSLTIHRPDSGSATGLSVVVRHASLLFSARLRDCWRLRGRDIIPNRGTS